MRSECERFKERIEPVAQNCLALAYHKLGRHADAESALAREKALEGDTGAVDYAGAYAQSGDIPTKHSTGWKPLGDSATRT
jgi:hypothetical protein